ncbi:MAG: tRNA 2-thiouridine(34) synthase MnmA [Acutalibacteraceae bacterium]
MKKALIAMSGGVDSSVAAYLIKEQGFECIGCTMKLYGGSETEPSSRSKTCCSLEDTQDARSVAYKLGMNYYVFNFTDDFREKVICKFARSYEQGRTPNPCIDCNRYMKFDKLFERAEILGCDFAVTGHYARIEEKNGKYVLKKAIDETKDQSYVLYSMTQKQLAHTLFPLGEMKKTQVRRLAESNGFINARKPDSQDICFVPDGDYAAFLTRFTGKEYPEGYFVGSDGSVLGKHKGIVRYTIGQRKGLGVSFGEPMYVGGINVRDNTVLLVREDELYSSELTAGEFNWISGEAPKGEIRCKAKIRYRRAEQWACVTPLGDNKVKIVFDEPQRAVTPGQAAVLYDGETVLGGGVIE